MSGGSSHWRPALRMARRDLLRHKVRAALTCVLVALPIIMATVAALTSYNTRWDSEREARSDMGNADAAVTVSPFAQVKPKAALWLSPRPASFVDGPGSAPLRRDPAGVDLPALLPPGSAVLPEVRPRRVALPSGGTLGVLFADLAPSALEQPARIATGRAPSAPDEVAVPRAVGDELGLLDAVGTPLDDARLTVGDDRSLHVVGVSEIGDFAHVEPFSLLAPLSSGLRPDQDVVTDYLVGLPALSRSELKALVADLNARGVMVRPRDAVLDPRAWGQRDFSGGPPVESLVVGATVVLVGLVEVVLLVGAAFAVAARRQVRDLGLLAANGAAAPDVRRVLLAQGLVLGIGSSVVGVAAGVGAFYGAARLWAPLGEELWRREVDWRALVLIAVLGSLTAVVAALLPAFSIARLTPVAALSGRFPVRPGESRAHRGAFLLIGFGLLGLLVGGWATARTFGPRGDEVTLAPAVSGLGLVLMIAGVVWAAPYVVRRVAAAASLLPLSGRYAFRDAGRHRFRTASATVALTVTVAGAVLAGFGFNATANAQARNQDMPANTMDLYVGPPYADVTDQAAAVRATVETVVGEPVGLVASYGLSAEDHPNRWVIEKRTGSGLRMTDEQSLRTMVGDDEEVLSAFRSGAVVLLGRGDPSTSVGTVRLRWARGEDRALATVPAVRTDSGAGQGGEARLGGALVSMAAARDLGLVPTDAQMLVTKSTPFTAEDLDRLRVYGLDGWSADPDRVLTGRLQFAGLGVAALLSAVVVGVAVALAAAESRDDVATLAAVGAGPWRRRSLGAMHGLFLGLVGGVLGVAVAVPAGLALTQLDGLPGVDVPWLVTAGTLAVVLLTAPVAGWAVTPSRLRLTRRSA